jgi:diguanylate cyclase (GGDEF)-like protein/excisionase family DNA binding protein
MVAAHDRHALADLVTLHEAAALAGVHRNTIRTWCAAGRLPYVRVNRRGERRIRRDDLDRVVSARSRRPASGPPIEAERRPHHQLARRAVGRADALRRIAADISGRVDLDGLFRDVIDDTFTLFGADRAGLWLYDDSATPLTLAAQRGLSRRILAEVEALPREARTLGMSAIRDRRVYVLDGGLEDTTPVLRRAYLEAGVRTICFVPIVFRDEPLGLLVIYHRREYDWSGDEIGLVRSFADAMAAALGNARLYESVRSLAARLDAIQELSFRLNRVQDTSAIGEAIIGEARSLISFDTIRIYRVDHGAGTCEPIAFQGHFLGTDHPTADMLRVPIGAGLTGWVAANSRTVLVGDAEKDGRGLVVGTTGQPESMLLVPMSFEDTVHGVIVVSQLGADRFTRDDERTLSIFAGYAAQAMLNAERLEQVGRQQAELEQQVATQRRLLEVSERLLSTLDPSGILEMIADSLRTVVAYDSLAIYRVDRARGVRRAVVARDRFADEILRHEYPVASGINGWAFEHGEAVLANDAHLDPRSVQVPGTPFEPESMIVVPLRVNGEVVGTLSIGRNGNAEAHFSEHEFELTKLFAAQASIALQNAETHGAVKVRAEHDALTGLRNHGSFQRELGEAIGGDHPFALLMLDFDGFKAFNDTRGHPAGDGFLAEAAAAMRNCVRQGDALYRYGGDEFAVILPGASRAVAHEIADRLRRTVAAMAAAEGPTVSLSAGVARFPDDGRTKDELLGSADAALYLAKPSSRARTETARDPYLAALDETAIALIDRLDPAALLETILARAAALVGTPHGYIYLVDDEGGLVLRNGLGLFERLLGFRLPSGTGLAGRVQRTGEPVVVDDYDAFEGRSPDLPRSTFGAVVGMPLTSGRKVVGVVGLAAGVHDRRFDSREVAALRRFAQLASIALDNAQLFEAAQRGVLYDPLTGLPNRQLLVDRATRALDTVDPRGVALLRLDLRRFEMITEALGHAVADRLLVAVGQRLAGCLRPDDTVARIGGEAFGIVVESVAGAGEAAAIAERVLAELRMPFDLGGRDWYIGASIGIALGQRGESTPDDLLREAELALDRAKADPTARHALFEPTMRSDTLARIDLENDLRRAIERRELRVHYQPIVDLATERVVGLEALVRWQHPVRGLVVPSSFIPLAEETGLIVPLGRWMLEAACRRAKAWRDAFPERDLSMSVNLSAREFAQPDLADQVAAILARTRLEPGALEVEITESVLMEESGTGTSTLRSLRELGVRLALDDFGTGYSSLSYLRHLPLDTIKIDRAFITRLEDQPANVPIVNAVTSLAHGLGIAVVAEGIETAAQAARLRGLGCDLGQGFLYAPALPAAQIGRLLRRSRPATQLRLPRSRSRNRKMLTKLM